MKKLLAIPLLVLCSIFCTAQQWDSLGNGMTGGGGDEWGVYTLTPYKGNIFAGGQFGKAGGFAANGMAEWNGVNWLSMDTAPAYVNVFASCVYDSLLYVGGKFDSIGNKAFASIASWDGVNWKPVGSGVKFILDFGIYSMCVYNGELYVGGYFDSIGGIPASNIAKWNGSTWSAVGSGTSFKVWSHTVYSLCVYNGELYAGGFFDSAGGIAVANIARWNGASWSQVSTGIKKIGGVYAMAEYNGLLYVGGNFDSAGGKPINNIAKWDGASWMPVAAGIPYNKDTNAVYALSVFESKLCVGGAFDTAGGIPANNIAFWNGTNWGTISTGVFGSYYPSVFAICSLNSTLYAGGEFLTAGGVPANNIAQWTGTLGINQLRANDEQITVYPNPSNGIFTFKIRSEQLSNSIMEVYNVLGEKVLTSEFKKGNTGIIDLSSQPNGLCFYRLISNNGASISEGKLVIAK